MNGSLPYVLQSCSLPAALSTGFCYQVPTADWIGIPTCYNFTYNRHSSRIHLTKSTSFSSRLQIIPAVIIIIIIIIIILRVFTPKITVLFHSYTQHICQSHPQHRWHKLLQFNKLPPTEFVCVQTNSSTVWLK